MKHGGTSHSSSDLLKICVKMGASWSAQVLRQAGYTPSGPGAFLLLFFMKTCHTSSSLIFSAGVGRGGLLEVLMVVWRGVQGGCGVFFQTYSKSHSNRLLDVDSPQCWGMVSCDL